MKITKREIRKIIREEKARIARKPVLTEQAATMPPEELIAQVQKVLDLVSKVDEYLNLAAGTASGDTAMNVDMAFEANGDVEFQLQNMIRKLQGN